MQFIVIRICSELALDFEFGNLLKKQNYVTAKVKKLDIKFLHFMSIVN